MKRFLKNENVLADCKIYKMLSSHGKHLSFHTPGHKIGKWDLTELSFSDNLSAPTNCIKQAEEDIAKILGSAKSFILTDGSTSGVFSMLYAAKSLGMKAPVVLEPVHKSVYNACEVLGLSPFFASSFDELLGICSLSDSVDGIVCTSPNYYGNVLPLPLLRRICDERNRLLLIDGAHGGHLHFDKDFYAGAYADLWVDGVHKSLPAFTQGAVVSARTERLATALQRGVDVFRTTSPSYPIMASVEYAVKYPRNESLEQNVRAFAKKHPDFIKVGADWTKLRLLCDENAFDLQKELEERGIYAEFCDGREIVFYLSPATTNRDFSRLKTALTELFPKCQKLKNPDHAPAVFKEIDENEQVELVELSKAEGRICAMNAGLFPPCIPLIKRGEVITKEKIELLQSAPNVYGLIDRKITVIKRKE